MDETGAYDTRSPADVDPRGVAQVTPNPFGPTVPGETRIAVQDQTEGASQGPPPSAVDRERIPRRYQHHAREYLDALIGKDAGTTSE